MEIRFRRTTTGQPQDIQLMTFDELAHEIAEWHVRPNDQGHAGLEWNRYWTVVAAYKERMATEDYLKHQYGHTWDKAHVHKSYSDHDNSVPTGEFEL